LEREKLLLTQLVASWPRRGASLLELGCGAGHFLELFWSAGFDVTGIDVSRAMLDAARKRLGQRAELRLGNAASLPFDDDDFEYAAFVTSLECMEEPEVALAEAFRVASRGVVVVFLNCWSLYWVEKHLAVSLLGRLPAFLRPAASGAGTRSWLSPLRVWKMMRAFSGKNPLVCRSVLFSPAFLWRKRQDAPLSASWAGVAPFGAVTALRVDCNPFCVTPRVIPVSKTVPAVHSVS
jgi:SAM-dependent methyltransferase